MPTLAKAQGWMLGGGGHWASPMSCKWGAIYPTNTWLQIGRWSCCCRWALLGLAALGPISNLAAGCVTGFVLLPTLFAARWGPYPSFVPYDQCGGPGRGPTALHFGVRKRKYM